MRHTDTTITTSALPAGWRSGAGTFDVHAVYTRKTTRSPSAPPSPPPRRAVLAIVAAAVVAQTTAHQDTASDLLGRPMTRTIWTNSPAWD